MQFKEDITLITASAVVVAVFLFLYIIQYLTVFNRCWRLKAKLINHRPHRPFLKVLQNSVLSVQALQGNIKKNAINCVL